MSRLLRHSAGFPPASNMPEKLFAYYHIVRQGFCQLNPRWGYSPFPRVDKPLFSCYNTAEYKYWTGAEVSTSDNRETGVNPARTRHCNRMAFRHCATGETWEGGGRAMIRKSGNLPVFESKRLLALRATSNWRNITTCLIIT